jgi:hypothetical protein
MLLRHLEGGALRHHLQQAAGSSGLRHLASVLSVLLRVPTLAAATPEQAEPLLPLVCARLRAG